MNVESRALPGSIRANGSSRMVEGYAIIFNRFSQDLGGFREIIKPEAITGVIEKSDILALLNHSEARGVLARCLRGNGSLSLTVDDKGLKYSFESPNFPLGDELLENIRRKEVVGSSFSFTCGPDGDYFERDSTQGYVRVIQQFHRLFDVSPVYNPAYESTSVGIAKFERAAATSQSMQQYQRHIELLRRSHNASELLHKQKINLS